DCIALVEQVLDGCKQFDAVADWPRSQQVEREIRIELELILVVIKLVAHRASLYAQYDDARIRVASLKRELMTRDLRDSEAFERSVRREVQYRGIDKLIATGDGKQAGDSRFGFNVESLRTRAAQIPPLARDQCGCDRQCHIRDRPIDFTPEK